MEKEKTKKSKTLLDRLQDFLCDPPIDSKVKTRRIKEKLNGPRTVNERFDGWGDDVEED
jgi:hypothetical protein